MNSCFLFIWPISLMLMTSRTACSGRDTMWRSWRLLSFHQAVRNTASAAARPASSYPEHPTSKLDSHGQGEGDLQLGNINWQAGLWEQQCRGERQRKRSQRGRFLGGRSRRTCWYTYWFLGAPRVAMPRSRIWWRRKNIICVRLDEGVPVV